MVHSPISDHFCVLCNDNIAFYQLLRMMHPTLAHRVVFRPTSVNKVQSVIALVMHSYGLSQKQNLLLGNDHGVFSSTHLIHTQ